jgi:Zn-dependent peptidase ImmA (M78 family)
MPPDRREVPEQSASKRIRRVEQLADNFAAGLLMPQVALDKLIPQNHLDNPQHLAEVARQLQVSTAALAFRLYNAKAIDADTRDALRLANAPKLHVERPKRFSSAFATLLHNGIADGHVSTRKAAKALSMTLEQLAALMTEHGKAVPFAI